MLKNRNINKARKDRMDWPIVHMLVMKPGHIGGDRCLLDICRAIGFICDASIIPSG